MTPTERFAHNLIERRKTAGLTPEDLARQASMPLAQIRSIEKGEEEPALETLVKLAGSLNAPIEALLVGLTWDPDDGLSVSDPD